jgi:outer membrane cobalamin receptor
VSARRSYLDLLLKRIDDENSLAFGFSDAEAKAVFDVTPKHHVEALVIAGASRFTEKPEGLGLNDEARVNGRSWLAAFNWRYTPLASVAITQRVYTTGLAFDSLNASGDSLDDSRSTDAGWRVDATIAARRGWLIELGADAQRLTGAHAIRRSLNDAGTVTTIADYTASGRAAAAYAQVAISPWSRLTVTPGVRVDDWSAAVGPTPSPWANAELSLTPGTRLRTGGGVYRQFPDLEQRHGVRGGEASLRPERATHLDISLVQALPLAATLQITWFARDEQDVLWTPGAEPRLRPDGTVQLGRGDARWANRLDGRARGVEVVLRRDAPAGLSGWVAYAHNRHRYTDATSSESFWSDADQRHAVSLFGHYRLSNRTTFGAKFRYGSNYPRAGYIAERPPAPGAPPLLGGEIPLFYGLSDTRNTLRLPAYARLDVRGDRTFTWSGRRVTLFAEVANAFNRRNLRNVPYGVDSAGRVIGGTDAMMPILPSAGFVIEF